MLYRIRINGEVVFAAGPRAERRVPVPRGAEASPEILVFTRDWRQLTDLPPAVAADQRLEIEVRDDAKDSWRPFEGREEASKPSRPSQRRKPSKAS